MPNERKKKFTAKRFFFIKTLNVRVSVEASPKKQKGEGKTKMASHPHHLGGGAVV
jgi:hypothetical protein|tara:strand:- start:269 stop:433 length:165 start_codon:yes stop_codon:yes gene_type:complete